MDTNYKMLDRKSILNYLKLHPNCLVDDLRDNSGAEPLRIYPLLFELEAEGVIQIMERTAWGAPYRIALDK